MLSILIPTYNYCCLQLVSDLQKQCEEVQAVVGTNVFDYEIIVADDASTDRSTCEKNELMELLPNCRFVQMQENVGRAILRNWLIDEARFDYLLFIDADATVTTDDFIWAYWEKRNEADVLVGKILTPPTKVSGHELRWKYEQKADKTRSAAQRNIHPEQHLSTFNLWLSRQVVITIRFDERCTDYGYEDALMGIEIAKRGFTILHLDIPLLHTGINTNAAFLENTETSLRTLVKLGSPMTDHARISQIHQHLVGLHLHKIFLCGFSLLKTTLQCHLLSHHPSLLLFYFYKLGYYTEIMERHSQSHQK